MSYFHFQTIIRQVKQDYLRFSMQDNANHKYSDAGVYFENYLFQHCAKVYKLFP